jgi:hypothetical protein
MPSGKLVKIGVWERNKFIGVIIYGMGATPNLCRPYGLGITQVCELVRIALTDHINPVSQMIARSLKMLKGFCPGLKLVVSFADTNQNHSGIIYQATNWIYSGISSEEIFWQKAGKIFHPRSLVAKHGTRARSAMLSLGYTPAKQLGKHRYLMPLDKQMRRRLKPLNQPYPKRKSIEA